MGTQNSCNPPPYDAALNDRPNNSPPCCALCGRSGSALKLTRHHLVPRSQHRKTRCRRQHPDRDERNRTVDLCRPCHGQVHAVLSEQELSAEYHTLDRLAAHPEVARFVEWVKDKSPDLRIHVHKTTDRRSQRRRR